MDSPPHAADYLPDTQGAAVSIKNWTEVVGQSDINIAENPWYDWAWVPLGGEVEGISQPRHYNSVSP